MLSVLLIMFITAGLQFATFYLCLQFLLAKERVKFHTALLAVLEKRPYRITATILNEIADHCFQEKPRLPLKVKLMLLAFRLRIKWWSLCVRLNYYRGNNK